jgi:lipid II:glycine glycyltransferase (peptidoglycan interpeptide bridge formation enzyme)
MTPHTAPRSTSSATPSAEPGIEPSAAAAAPAAADGTASGGAFSTAALLQPLPTPPDAAWDSFVAGHGGAHILQTAGWGALKSRFGWRATRVALGDGDGLPQAGAQLLFKRQLGLTLGYVPRGPLVDWQDAAAVRTLLASLTAACRSAGAAVLKLEPELPDTPATRSLLASFGLRPSSQTVQPRSTIVFDLQGDDDALLARMKSKWRYNVRLAERKGVTVRPCSEADLPAFNALMADTATRDRFDVHDPAYYSAAFRLLAPHAVFLLAEFEGQPLAAIVVCAVGARAWYLWGASSDRERNRMPNHALQWAGIRWARERGATLYDFWGIPDDLGALAQGLRNGDGSGTPVDLLPVELEALPHEGLWGVYRFKQGFGGLVTRTVGAWDLPVNPVGDAVYRAGLTARATQQTLRRSAAGLRQTLAARQGPASGPESAPAVSATGTSALRPVSNAGAWRTLLAGIEGAPPPHVLQSWEWGATKAQTGWQAERLALGGGQAAFQFLTRQPLPWLPLRIGYVPKGPVVDWGDPARREATLDALQAHARARRCILVKIDPDVEEQSPEGVALLASLRRRGWLFSNEQVQFKNTGVSDLRPDPETLLEAMKSKTRYNVRLAAKRGITVRAGSERDFESFYSLYAETAARDGFLIRPAAYYRLTWEHFLRAQGEAGNPAGGLLLLAEHAEETAPVAGIFLLRYGATAWYFYGASSERRRRDMPNHLLQWEAMRWARAQGCSRYDWWGAPTHPADPEDAMQGVWGFKEGFGAELKEHVGAWDYPVWPPLYRAYAQALPRVLAAMRRRATP